MFLAAAWRIVSAEWPQHPARFLLLIFGVLALMSQLYELLYHRSFWQLLGATLAIAVRRNPEPAAGLAKA